MHGAVMRPAGPFVTLQLAVKRLVDIVGATMGLAVCSPLLMAAAVAIKLSSPGPILYRWRIAGQHGRPIQSLKFRTMVPDADARKAALAPHNQMRGPVFKLERDPRVTRIGRLLRRTSIDELPQLWSVLMGDLSLVGPRPPLQSEYARFTPYQRQKLLVKPGVTCTWQARGRSTIADFDDWLAMDLEYIRTWSLRKDFEILLATVPAVLKGTGAH